MPLVISGWGGDRWMRFSDFYIGLDRTLPGDVIFAALDNIDPSVATTVAEAYGKLSPARQRWPMPWWESDGAGTRRDQWGPQCNAGPLLPLCRDALAKNCQGMLAIHWRTRDVEEAAALQAQFAWNPQLTYEQFFDDFAAAAMGGAGPPKWAPSTASLKPWPALHGRAGADRMRPVLLVRQRQKAQTRESCQARRASRPHCRRPRGHEGKEGRSGPGAHRLAADHHRLAHALRCRGRGVVQRRRGRPPADRGGVQETAGDHAAARALAVKAAERFNNCGLAEALRTYPWKMSTCGEWGVLATVNVKPYAAYERIAQRIKSLGGEPAADSHTLPQPQAPRIVMRTPPSIVEPGKAVEVAAIVIAKQPEVTLRYRRPGQEQWLTAAMKNTFRRAWIGAIPAAAVSKEGIEYAVEARDAAGQTAFAPSGYPGAVWSASGMDLP